MGSTVVSPTGIEGEGRGARDEAPRAWYVGFSDGELKPAVAVQVRNGTWTAAMPGVERAEGLPSDEAAVNVLARRRCEASPTPLFVREVVPPGARTRAELEAVAAPADGFSVAVPRERLEQALRNAWRSPLVGAWAVDATVTSGSDAQVGGRDVVGPVFGGGAVTVRAEHEGGSFVLDRAALARGLAAMAAQYPRRFGDLLTDDRSDEQVADVLLQCCLFGRLVFG